MPLFHPDEALEYPMTDKQREQLLSYLDTHAVSDEYQVLCYRDVQLFLKRLRKYINENDYIPTQGKYLRFFVCGEYGETFGRPHYHIMFFSNSAELCERHKYYGDGGEQFTTSLLESYVRKAWQQKGVDNVKKPIGRIDFQRASGSASYVASYVNCLSSIPAFLRENAAFRPFCHSSSSPPIGTKAICAEEAWKVVSECLDRFSNPAGNEIDFNTDIPLLKSIKDSLLPRVPRYVNLSSETRRSLLSIALYPYVGAEFNDFCEWLMFSWEAGSVFALSICDVLEINNPIELTKKDKSKLRRLWTLSNRVLFNASYFNVSFGQYCNIIENFYVKEDYKRLCKQLKEEMVIAFNYGLRYIPMYVDPCVLDNFNVIKSRRIMSSYAVESLNIGFYDIKNLQSEKERISKIVNFVEIGKTYKRKGEYKAHYDNLNKL